jgi:hypothetical protein
LAEFLAAERVDAGAMRLCAFAAAKGEDDGRRPQPEDFLLLGRRPSAPARGRPVTT